MKLTTFNDTWKLHKFQILVSINDISLEGIYLCIIYGYFHAIAIVTGTNPEILSDPSHTYTHTHHLCLDLSLATPQLYVPMMEECTM